MTWTTQNKRQPGAYVRFKSSKEQRSLVAGEGVLAVLLDGQSIANTGFHTVYQDTDLAKTFGADVNLTPIKEALAVAKEVLVYQAEVAAESESITKNVLTTFLEALSSREFKVVAIGLDKDADKAKVAEKIKELRAEGRGVVAVLNDYAKADSEGIISVANGVTLGDGTVLTAKEAVYRVGALMATAGVKSLTHAEYVGAIDCERKPPKETEDLLNKGNIVFKAYNGRIVIVQDINTLTTLGDDQNDDFKKNKLVRTMDIIGEAIQAVFVENFIGQVVNDLNGRELFKQQLIVRVLDPLVATRSLSYATEDIVVSEGSSKEAILVEMGVKLTDAMEKLYVTVEVK